MNRRAARACTTAACLAAAPSVVSFGPARRLLTPGVAPAGLSGLSARHHVALTFDDGPDIVSTPSFLRLLAELGVSATFFVLGQHVGDQGLLREVAQAGHEVAVHGWDHRPVALHTPRGLRDGLVRTRDLIEDVTGDEPRWYRPPYGLCTVASWWAAERAGLRTVLWSAWGRDWARNATPTSVARRVTAQLSPGDTVLLHDSDRTSAPGSWRTTLVATEHLVRRWQAAGLEVGPLRTHWSAAVA